MEEAVKTIYIGVAAVIFALALSMLLILYKEYINVTKNEPTFRKEAVIHNER
ncbi:MAG: hypothetical protein IJC76_03020 [Lachnospiraceae bacterium]|nr:hypothetical protein [Lachnospiraceae bacterium]